MEATDSTPRVTRGVIHGLMVVALAAVLCLPCLLVGIPPGYDSEYHTAYQYHFTRQFWNGDVYPRWLTGSNKGYGTPIFLVQYPLPYSVAALLRPVMALPANETQESRELGFVCFLAVAAAGLAARSWFRRRCAPLTATIGAAVYISLPYILGESLYLRTGLGELCAFVWMPLALARCETLRPTFTSVSALAMVCALLLLTHLTSALLFFPFLIAYAAVSGPERGAWLQRVGSALVSLVLGVALAAIYILPFAAYRHLFDLDAMRAIIPSFELGRWFAYVTSSSIARRLTLPAMGATIASVVLASVFVARARASLVSRLCMGATLVLGTAIMIPDIGPSLIRSSGITVSAFETAGDFPARMLFTGLMTTALGFLAYCDLGSARTGREHVLLAAVCASFLLTLPWTAVLWMSDSLAQIQFPFRLGANLTVAAAGLFAAAIDARLRQPDTGMAVRRVAILACAVAVVIGTGAFIWRVPMRFASAGTTDLAVLRNVDNMFRSYVPPEHVSGFARRVAADPHSFDVTPTPLDDYVRGNAVRAEVIGGPCAATVMPVRPGMIRASAQCRDEARLRIGQVYSPLWTLVPKAGSSTRQQLGSSDDGLVEVALAPGSHEVDIVFDVGWPERVGSIVTLGSSAAVFGTALIAVYRRRRTTPVCTL